MLYRKLAWSVIGLAGAGVIATGISLGLGAGGAQPEDLLIQYMEYAEAGEYEKMYDLLDEESQRAVDKTSFTERYSNIYEGIDVSKITLSEIEAEKGVGKNVNISYHMTMDTVAGELKFDNEIILVNDVSGYSVHWDDGIIYPGLQSTDKIRVNTEYAQRGEVLDRNGRVIAGQGTAYSVGIVPGKLKDRENSLKELARLMQTSAEAIEQKLEAAWVTDESFVPIGMIEKYEELEKIRDAEEETESGKSELQDALTEIPGVMLTDTEVRSYSLGEAAAHLIGYVQTVTAEDLEEHEGEGYTTNSVIGRSGVEALYETQLRGKNGYEISIVDSEGKTKIIIADTAATDGGDIQVTIETRLQELLYENFEDVRGCSVALNPYTGEVLALVSTPSYDNNMFIRGVSNDEWTALNEDEDKPMYNRFRQAWTPGSTFKPITASIGLKQGVIDGEEDMGSVGVSWQKDGSWGDYYITTLHDYSPVTLSNALAYSDNIYFARTALRIGEEELEQNLDLLGFGQAVPFEINMTPSQYSNGEGIETEIQLADSGYGQGEMLVNPLHLAALYTAFLNDGTVMKPTMLYEEGFQGEAWIPDAFSSYVVETVMEGLKQVITDQDGTGYGAYRKDLALAGKTGTAEIKASKEDKDGSEIGWFVVFTTDEETSTPILLVSMMEDVKDLDGSEYVVERVANVLEEYISRRDS